MPRIEIKISSRDSTVTVTHDWQTIESQTGEVVRGELSPELAYELMDRALAGLGIKEDS